MQSNLKKNIRKCAYIGSSDREPREGLAVSTQRLLVFQQNGRGESKSRGIQAYGEGLFELEVMSLDCAIPAIVDDSSEYLPSDFQADLVLDYLKHPDLSYDLAVMCKNRGIPLIASGKKYRVEGAFTPMICCALSRHCRLGQYGDRFGAPEFAVEIEGERIRKITVLRGAPCGSSWEAAARMAGASIEGAAARMGLEVQFFCTADPSGWDPMYGKSPVHLAAEIHRAALCRAMASSNSSLSCSGPADV
jgi:thymidylate synthase